MRCTIAQFTGQDSPHSRAEWIFSLMLQEFCRYRSSDCFLFLHLSWAVQGQEQVSIWVDHWEWNASSQIWFWHWLVQTLRKELKHKQFIWEVKGTGMYYREGETGNKWHISCWLPLWPTERNLTGETCKIHVDTHPSDLPILAAEGAGVIHRLLSVIGWGAPRKHWFMGSKVTYRPGKSLSEERRELEVSSQDNVCHSGEDGGI